MPWYAVDAKDRVAQGVMPGYGVEPDGRFYVVEADTPHIALAFAIAARDAGCMTVSEFKARQYAAGLAAASADA